ncbi:MAG: class I SAM-dependent methyltransferase [Lachnospiraceae bacterium]|nr:class I SAM-dependent methyltransferase [Lachnospiraceae bacterium]
MVDEKHIVETFYQKMDEEERLADRQGYVEYVTTMSYIHKYLKPHMQIAEIGAGTGRYSLALSREGHHVEAVELVEHNIQVFRSKLKKEDDIHILQGNALNLSAFADDSMDITLLLGPMYHLFTEEHKKKALAEALRITRPGGILFVAYCMNEATVLQYCFGRETIWEDMQKGLLAADFTWTANENDAFSLVRPADIRELTKDFPVERLHLVAADGATRYLGDRIEHMEERLYQKYLEYHFSICEREDLIGASNHVLDVLQKV